MNTEMIMNDEMFETALNAQMSKGMTDEWKESCEHLMNEIIAPFTTGFDEIDEQWN
jgi:hypothetical protein